MSSVWTVLFAAERIKESLQCPPPKLRSEILSKGNQVMQALHLPSVGLTKGKRFPHSTALKSFSIYQTGGPKETGLILWFKCPSLSMKLSLKYELAAWLLKIKLLLWSKSDIINLKLFKLILGRQEYGKTSRLTALVSNYRDLFQLLTSQKMNQQYILLLDQPPSKI